jgi:hypothetical protein
VGFLGLNARSNNGSGKTFNNSSLTTAATLSLPSMRHSESKGNEDDEKNMSMMMASRADKAQSRGKAEEKPRIMSILAGGNCQIGNPSEHSVGSIGVGRHHYCLPRNHNSNRRSQPKMQSDNLHAKDYRGREDCITHVDKRSLRWQHRRWGVYQATRCVGVVGRCIMPALTPDQGANAFQL